jgi:hypothetical protein
MTKTPIVERMTTLYLKYAAKKQNVNINNELALHSRPINATGSAPSISNLDRK